MPEAPKLLPCPFCGKQPTSQWIGCNAPGMEDCGYWGIDCCMAHSHADSEEEAVAAWNERPAPPSPDGLAEALRPFARLAETIAECEPRDYILEISARAYEDRSIGGSTPTVADWRRLLAAWRARGGREGGEA